MAARRPGSAASAAISAASRSGVNSAWSRRIAPPASISTPALARWSWSSACGSGTRMPGRPIAASSATVEAPERDTTRWLAAMRAGRSVKNGATSQATCSLRIGVADARQILLARLLHDLQPRPQTRLELLDRPAARCRPSPARPGCRRTRGAAAARRRRAADRASPPPRSPPAAPDCRCASPWRRAPDRDRECRESRWRWRARAAPASGWRGPSPRSARGSGSECRAALAASSGGKVG